MVFAINIFLNDQLCCLHWQDHQTEKPTELDKGQLNMNTISQAYHISKVNLLSIIISPDGVCARS